MACDNAPGEAGGRDLCGQHEPDGRRRRDVLALRPRLLPRGVDEQLPHGHGPTLDDGDHLNGPGVQRLSRSDRGAALASVADTMTLPLGLRMFHADARHFGNLPILVLVFRL
jgi:hypothetical protein